MTIPSIKVALGKQRFSESPRWPTENDYIASVKRQTDGLAKSIRALMQAFEDVSVPVMLEALQPTFELTQEQVPVDTGALKESGYLEEARIGNKPRVEIGYGYRNVPYYTQLVHERVDIRHAPPTKAKFLQDPVLADLPNIFLRLGQKYKLALGG